MKPCHTDIDWSAKPEPWNEVGPRLREECEVILASGHIISGVDLSNRRKELGLLQKEVAKITGFHRETVSSAERGEGTSSVLERIQSALVALETAL